MKISILVINEEIEVRSIQRWRYSHHYYLMVLELKVPHGTDINDLKPLIPIFLSYLLSFIYVGIYWNNHHHMLYLVEKINGKTLWANMALLFWLSLIPFVTAWAGENYMTKWPVICYGLVLIMCGVSYVYLAIVLKNEAGPNSNLARAFGADWKGKLSTTIYVIGVISAFYFPIAGIASYILVACIWFIPDRRVEKLLVKN